MTETDPDPTQPNRGCEIQACPCRALGRAADTWAIAAAFVRELDNESDARVIDFVPPRVRRR